MRIFVALVLFFLTSSPIITSAAVVGIPFGGVVTAVQPCNTGLLAYVKSPKPPYVFPVMWLWGELPFRSYIPPHPGQFVLGKAAPVTAPCFLGFIPYGVGFPIMFHGSSL